MAKKKMLGETVTVRVVLPIELYKKVQIAAQEDDRFVSQFLRVMIQENLPD